MATSSLLLAVQSALGAATTLGYSSSVEAHDVYEAYILTLFLEAARNKGWTWQLRDDAGNPTAHAVFRLGPGRLPSPGYTHVYLAKAGKQPLEAHLGVKVHGQSLRHASKRTKSGYILHEFDLLVLPSKAASLCRVSKADPSYSDVTIHAEAKFYGGNLQLPVGRMSVGMAVECQLAGKSVLVSNRIGLTVQDLVEHHNISFRYRVTPASSTAEFHMVSRFEGMLFYAR